MKHRALSSLGGKVHAKRRSTGHHGVVTTTLCGKRLHGRRGKFYDMFDRFFEDVSPTFRCARCWWHIERFNRTGWYFTRPNYRRR